MSHVLRAIVSRVLALGVLALALVAFGYVAPLLVYDHFRARSEEIADAGSRLARLKAEIRMLEAAAQQRPAPTGGKAAAATMTAANEASALAAMQTKLGEMAQQQGIRFDSVASLSSQDVDGVHLIGVHVQFSADAAKLHELLYTLETSRPLLIIDTLDFNGTGSRLIGVDSHAGANEPPPIIVGLDILAAFTLLGA
jgi:Type II secretion system (T2SS), protein M subtype b